MSKLFLVGCFPPEMRSIGDHAQTLALTNYLKQCYRDYELVVVTRDTPKILDVLLGKVEKDDLIFMSSSGDFGSFHAYNGWHETRKKIIEAFRDNRVVQLPVTVFYEDTAAGYGLFERDKTFFCDLPNFLLLARTPCEAKLLQNNFSCRVNWFPDFAYNLQGVESDKRLGALVVLRDDLESIQNAVTCKNPSYLEQFFARRTNDVNRLLRRSKPKSFREMLRFQLEKRFNRVVFKDVQVSDVDVTNGNRKNIISDVLCTYGEFEVVVTDRFHAAIFAALMGTPCVVLPSRVPHKITGGLDLLPNVVGCGNIENVLTDVNLALKLRFERLDYQAFFNGFRSSVEKQFMFKAEKDVSAPVDVIDVVKQRRSVRRWLPTPVNTDVVRVLLEAGYYAPSAANMQAVKILAEMDTKILDFLRRNSSPWFGLPSLAFLFLYDTSQERTLKLDFEGWHGRFIWQDTACAAMNVMLVAESLGLKSCWASVQPKQEQAIKKKLQIQDYYVLACMVFLGYSNQQVSLESLHQGKPIKRDMI